MYIAISDTSARSPSSYLGSAQVLRGQKVRFSKSLKRRKKAFQGLIRTSGLFLEYFQGQKFFRFSRYGRFYGQKSYFSIINPYSSVSLLAKSTFYRILRRFWAQEKNIERVLGGADQKKTEKPKKLLKSQQLTSEYFFSTFLSKYTRIYLI